MGLGNDRAEVIALVRVGTDFQRLHGGLHLLDQRISRSIAYRNGNGQRHAALTGGAEGRAQQLIDGIVHVRVGHHDGVVLGATQCLAALAVGIGGLVDVLGDRRRADEADSLYARVVQQHVDRFLVAVDHVHHALGQPGFCLLYTSPSPRDS